jgi:hypothetical protein
MSASVALRFRSYGDNFHPTPKPKEANSLGVLLPRRLAIAHFCFLLQLCVGVGQIID